MISKGKVVGGNDQPTTDGRLYLKVRLLVGTMTKP